MTAPLSFTRGEYWERTLHVVDGSGTPINWTGYTAKMQIKIDSTSAQSVATLSTDDGSIVMDTAGNIFLTLTSLQTLAIKPGTYVTDLWVVPADNKPRPLARFDVTVIQRITMLA